MLVVGAYAMTKFVDPHDKKTSTIFADGAGAVVLESSTEPGLLASELFADGRLAPGMGVFAGGTAEPITQDVLDEGYRNKLRFVTKYPREVNEVGWPRIARSVLDRIGKTPADVDEWLWTQVNLWNDPRSDEHTWPVGRQGAYDHGKVGIHGCGLSADGARRLGSNRPPA